VSAEPGAREARCLQERFAPASSCFGCGPANAFGLRVRSFPTGTGDDTSAEWTPAVQHEAFPGVLAGGVIGALLDCHSNWTAAWHLLRRDGLEHPPCTVTAEYAVTLKRPAPTKEPVRLLARVVESTGDRVVVEAELVAAGKTCATCRGVFVAVKPGHPAHHRW